MSPAPDLLQLLDHIERLPDGGYRLADGSREALVGYLAPYGFSLDRLRTCDELLDALGYCNSLQFEELMRKPAPNDRLRFIWNRLRNLGKPSAET